MFVGRYIKGVKNQPSPAWLQQRLKAIGLRPINALVDVTNYISYDRARPLHVYDADKLKGAIHARLGEKGESFVALDGRTYEVDGGHVRHRRRQRRPRTGRRDGRRGQRLHRRDDQRLHRVRPISIRCAPPRPAAAPAFFRTLGFRFERGIDPQSAPLGANLATQMILEICGGSASRMAEAGKAPAPREPIAFNVGLVERLTGVQYKAAEIAATLERLGFAAEAAKDRIIR